jgi:hypothetical protein
MPDSHNSSPSRRRLVGQPLLYAISVFASLGVFLVSAPLLSQRFLTPGSLDMTKGTRFPPL